MMSLSSILLLTSMLLSVTKTINAQGIDASLGTFSCYPCGRAFCGFAGGGDDDINIDPRPQFGYVASRNFESMTCKEIQLTADRREMDPEMCSYYSQLTLSSADPCDCRRRRTIGSETSTPDKCINPNQQRPCNLCGTGKVIGDPEKFFRSDDGFGGTCENFFNTQEENLAENQGGFSTDLCSDLQGLFGQHCQCVTPADFTTVTRCVSQMDPSSPCDPSLPDNQCCVGKCKYLSLYNKHLCTTLKSSPTSPPTRFPTNSPTVPLTEEEPLNLAPPKPIPDSGVVLDFGTPFNAPRVRLSAGNSGGAGNHA